MAFIWAEARKQRAFREARVGAVLAVLFMSLSISMNSSDLGAQSSWFFIQQDIHRFVGVLTALLLVVGLSRLMCCETEWKTAGLVGTAARGPASTFGAKAGLSVLYCAAVVFALGAAALGIEGALMGFQGALEPVSECVYFESVPLSNISFCVLQYVFLFLGALYFAGFILIVGAATKRASLTVPLCGGSYLALVCYQFFVDGRLRSSNSLICQVIRPVSSFIFRFSFCGFMQLESYRWTATLRWPGQWENVWKPVLFVLAATAAEFAVLGIIWRRGAKT